MRTAPFITAPERMEEFREIREAYGVSVGNMKAAVDVAQRHPRYREDFLMALAWVDANSLAIHVPKGRDEWNAARAENMVDVLFGERSAEAAAPR